MRRLALGFGVGTIALLACAGLKTADDAPVDGDGGDQPIPTNDGGSDANLDPVDAGPPPADFECDEVWTKTTKTNAACAPRAVKLIDTDKAMGATSVSIAHTKAGRIGISYYVAAFVDGGEMHVTHFKAPDMSFTPTVLKYAIGQYAKAGYISRMASSGNDTLEILAHDLYDTTGDVNLVRVIDGGGLSPTSLAFTSLASPTQLTLAADKNTGTLYAAALKTNKVDGGRTGDIIASRKLANADWALLPTLITGMDVSDAPGVGPAWMTVDAAGTLHFAYHWGYSFSVSTPRYHTFDGTSWSDRKTIDNNVPDGLSGWSLRLGVFGTKKYATYFSVKYGQSPPANADFRLATWNTVLDTPKVELLDQKTPSPDLPGGPDAPRVYRAAMDVDKFGLVHIAFIEPNESTLQSGLLHYMRQTVDATGSVQWLSDTVDDDVVGNYEALVDLVVDEKARPHIAYVSGKTNEVRYATRLDRQ